MRLSFGSIRLPKWLSTVLAVFVCLVAVDLVSILLCGIFIGSADLWKVICEDFMATWKERVSTLVVVNICFGLGLWFFVGKVIDKSLEGINWNNIRKWPAIGALTFVFVVVNAVAFAVEILKDNWIELWEIGVSAFTSVPAIVFIIAVDIAIVLIVALAYGVKNKKEVASE